MTPLKRARRRCKRGLTNSDNDPLQATRRPPTPDWRWPWGSCVRAAPCSQVPRFNLN